MSHVNGGLGFLSQAELDSATPLDMPFDRVDRVGGTSNPTDVFKFTLPEDGAYVIRIKGANGSSVVTTNYSVQAASSGGPPMAVRHEPARNELRTTLTGLAGQTYYVKIGTALFGTPEYQLTSERVGVDSNAFGRSLPTTAWLSPLSGTFDERNTRDVFKIVAQETGRLQISQVNLVSNADVYRSEGLQDHVSTGVSRNNGNLAFDVVAGQSYYISLEDFSQTTKTYNFTSTFTPPPAPPPPDNNETFDTARIIPAAGQELASQRVGGSDPADFFRITPSANSDLTFSLNRSPSSVPGTFNLFDQNRQLISQVTLDSTSGGAPTLRTIATGGQTYFVSVESSGAVEMNYILRTTVVGPDNDNSFETATTMSSQTIPSTPPITTVFGNGLLSAVDRSDYFKFTAPLTGSLRLLAAPVSFAPSPSGPILGGVAAPTTTGPNLDLRIYDSNFALLGEGASPLGAEVVEVAVVSGRTYYANVAMLAGDSLTSYSLSGGYANDTDNDFDRASALTPGVQVSGFVGRSTVDPADFFQFRANETGIASVLFTRTASANTSSPNSIRIGVFDSQRRFVTESVISSPFGFPGSLLPLDFPIEKDQTYFFKVYVPEAFDSGAYSIDLAISREAVTDGNDSFETATPIENSTRFGNRFIGAGDVKDYFVISPLKSESLSLSVTSNLGDVDLRVYDSQRTEVARSVARLGDDQITFSATAGSTYYAVVESVGAVPTRYGITLVPFVANSFNTPATSETTDLPGAGNGSGYATLPERTAYTGSLATPADSDWMVVDPSPGNSVLIRVAGVAGTTAALGDFEIRLRSRFPTSPGNYEILSTARGSASQPAELKLTDTGSSGAFLEIVSPSGAIGGYRVTVDDDPTRDLLTGLDIPGSTTSQVRLLAGQTLQSRLTSATDSDWFRFSAVDRGPTTLSVAGIGSELPGAQSVSIYLRDTTGLPIAEFLGSGQGLASLTIPDRGDYWVEVRSPSGAVGAYQISAASGAASAAMADVTTQTPASPLGVAADEGQERGQTHCGLLLAQATARVLTIGQTVTETPFTSSNTHQLYKFTATQAGVYRFSIDQTSPSFWATTLSVMDSRGLQIVRAPRSGESDSVVRTYATLTSSGVTNRTVEIAAAAGETYYMLFDNGSTGTGIRLTSSISTTAQLNDFATTAPIGTWPFSSSGTVGAGNAQDIYQFPVTEAGTIRFTMTGTDNFLISVHPTLANFAIGINEQVNGPLDFNGTGNRDVSFDVEPGRTYYVRVAQPSSGQATPYTLASTFVPLRDSNNTFDQAQAISLGATSASFNTPQDRYVGNTDPADFFRITPTLSGRIVISGHTRSVPSEPLGVLALSVYDGSQNLIDRWTASNSTVQRTINAVAGNTYYLKLESGDSRQVVYDGQVFLRATDQNESIATATPLDNLGMMTSGRIDDVDLVDYYRIVSPASGPLRVLLAAPGAFFLPPTNIQIVDANRSVLAESSGTTTSRLLSVDAAAGATYYVVVNHGGTPRQIDYRLAAGMASEPDDSAEGATDLVLGTTLQGRVGTVATDPVDFVRIRADATGRLRLTLTNVTPAASAIARGFSFSVLDSLQRVVANSSPTFSASQTIGVAQGEIYYVRIVPTSDASQNDYTLLATLSPEVVTDSNDSFESSTRVELSAAFFGRLIGGPDQRDVYDFTPTTTGPLVIDLTASNSDVDLFIYDASRRLVAQSRRVQTFAANERDISTTDSLTVYVEAGQKYFAVAEAVGVGRGPYQINFGSVGVAVPTVETTDVLPPPPPAIGQPPPATAFTSQPTTLYPGVSFVGTLGSATDIDSFRFGGSASGTRYIFRVEGADSAMGPLNDPDIRIHGLAGTTPIVVVGQAGQAAEYRFTVNEHAIPTLDVYSATRGTGGYRVTLSIDTAADAQDILGDIPGSATNSTGGQFNVTSNVRLDRGGQLTSRLDTTTDRDWIRVALRNGETTTVAVAPSTTNSASSVALRLRDHVGNVVNPSASEPAIQLQLTTAGEYWVEIYSPTGATGGYRLTASTGSSPPEMTAASFETTSITQPPTAEGAFASVLRSPDASILRAMRVGGSEYFGDHAALFAADLTSVAGLRGWQNDIQMLGMPS